jgi:hypothetical protein
MLGLKAAETIVRSWIVAVPPPLKPIEEITAQA